MRRNRTSNQNPLVLVLLLQLFQQIQRLERKPPVTIGLIGLMTVIFYYDGHPLVPRVDDFCLKPSQILFKHEYARLIVSAFLHGDEWHLYHNMVSFLWKGVNLEFLMGSIPFTMMLGILLILSHSLIVFAAWIMATFMHMKAPFLSCSIGFSAVLFALKVVLNFNSSSFTNIYGVQVPTKYAAWLELVVIHFVVPNASFVGHLSGIVAGYIFVKVHHYFSTKRGYNHRRRYRDHAAPSGYSSRNSRFNAEHPETDEELARRLQEEEFVSSSFGSQHHINSEEVRRRRLERYESTRRRY